MDEVTTPGEALGLVSAVLRHNGLGIFEAEAGERPKRIGERQFSISGSLVPLDDFRSLGPFTAEVLGNGRYVIKSGVFGLISDEHYDPFYDL